MSTAGPGIEPPTFRLAGNRSTTEPQPRQEELEAEEQPALSYH